MHGVLVAADITQQWLLPWFWEHYSRHNAYPVTFVDLGMSSDMKSWCQERGHYIALRISHLFVKEREEIANVTVANWENDLGKSIWESRPAWFKKPLACLQSPYEYTLWLDLDCQVLKPLNELFSLSQQPAGIALSKETAPGQYNAGVIAFRKGLALIEKWAELCLSSNDKFAGDQDVLCHLIKVLDHPVVPMPSRYNWSRFQKETSDTAILHWHGPQGKSCIELLMNSLITLV